MANQIDINDFINVLMEQRNSALNALAESSVITASLKKQLEEATQNETDNQDNTA
tara:strand:+ start:69 stop:233 length:165 start_codon:yes stop_codon:yes gene_type:complete